jgi:transcriptional regulator with XRE-family HTH domain
MKKTPNQQLSEWLDSLPHGEYSERRQQLADYCGVSKVVISFWKSGRTRIKLAYQRLIEEFAGKKIFDESHQN